MIDDIRQSTGHGIRPICEALGVPRSSHCHAAQATPANGPSPDTPPNRRDGLSRPVKGMFPQP
jgi:hypothetical protein